MDRQPHLRGERVYLRPLIEDDLEPLFEVARDPAIWEQHPAHDRWRPEIFVRFFADALEKGGALGIIDLTSQALIGSSRFQNYDPEDSSVEIGWTFLARRYWGKGVNHEVKRLMLAYAFEFVDRVDFKVGDTNYRSSIALERIGARRTERSEITRYDNRRVRGVYFSLTRAEFEEGPLMGKA